MGTPFPLLSPNSVLKSFRLPLLATSAYSPLHLLAAFFAAVDVDGAGVAHYVFVARAVADCEGIFVRVDQFPVVVADLFFFHGFATEFAALRNEAAVVFELFPVVAGEAAAGAFAADKFMPGLAAAPADAAVVVVHGLAAHGAGAVSVREGMLD